MLLLGYITVHPKNIKDIKRDEHARAAASHVKTRPVGGDSFSNPRDVFPRV